MKILVSGATGFIGRSLIPVLLEAGHEIYALVRKIDNRLETCIAQLTIDSLPTLEETMDAFINLAGEGIADKPWSEQRKKTLFKSRVELTKKIKIQLQKTPRILISMSAVGIYGSDSNKEYDENTLPDGGFSHDICDAWENAAKEFKKEGARLSIFRLGVVCGTKGGALEKMRPAYLCGLGGRIGKGTHWFPWIHIQDVINAIFLALEDDSWSGIYNLVAPDIIQQKEFAKAFALSLHRPIIFPLPAFVLKLIFGEMASLLTQGPKILPTRLINQAFKYQYDNINKALLQIEKTR